MTEEKVPTQADHDAVQLAVSALMREIGYDNYEWGSNIFGDFRFQTRDATKKVGYRTVYTGKVQIVLYNDRHAEKRWTPTLTKEGGLPTSTKNSITETVKAFDEQTKEARERMAKRHHNMDLTEDFLLGLPWHKYWSDIPYAFRHKVETMIGQPYAGPIIGKANLHHMDNAPKILVSLSIPVDTKEGKALVNTISDLVLEYLKARMSETARETPEERDRVCIG